MGRAVESSEQIARTALEVMATATLILVAAGGGLNPLWPALLVAFFVGWTTLEAARARSAPGVGSASSVGPLVGVATVVGCAFAALWADLGDPADAWGVLIWHLSDVLPGLKVPLVFGLETPDSDTYSTTTAITLIAARLVMLYAVVAAAVAALRYQALRRPLDSWLRENPARDQHTCEMPSELPSVPAEAPSRTLG